MRVTYWYSRNKLLNYGRSSNQSVNKKTDAKAQKISTGYFEATSTGKLRATVKALYGTEAFDYTSRNEHAPPAQESEYCQHRQDKDQIYSKRASKETSQQEAHKKYQKAKEKT
jgi:hypothetical protein